MKDLETKKNVLKEIMDLMDSREGDRLKKHPKLVAAQIEVGKPEIEAEEEEETPEIESEGEESEEISPEMIEALLEKLQDLK